MSVSPYAPHPMEARCPHRAFRRSRPTRSGTRERFALRRTPTGGAVPSPRFPSPRPTRSGTRERFALRDRYSILNNVIAVGRIGEPDLNHEGTEHTEEGHRISPCLCASVVHLKGYSFYENALVRANPDTSRCARAPARHSPPRLPLRSTDAKPSSERAKAVPPPLC